MRFPREFYHTSFVFYEGQNFFSFVRGQFTGPKHVRAAQRGDQYRVDLYAQQAHNWWMATKTERFAVRLTAEQDALIRRAAEVEGTDLTNFTVTATLAHARDVLADRERALAELLFFHDIEHGECGGRFDGHEFIVVLQQPAQQRHALFRVCQSQHLPGQPVGWAWVLRKRGFHFGERALWLVLVAQVQRLNEIGTALLLPAEIEVIAPDQPARVASEGTALFGPAARHFADQVGEQAAQADHAQDHQRGEHGAGELGTQISVQLRHRACLL